jgi:hypothetical protein
MPSYLGFLCGLPISAVCAFLEEVGSGWQWLAVVGSGWQWLAVAILANAPIPDGLGVSADLMAKVGVRFGAQDVFSCVKVLYASFVFHDVSHSS